MVSGVKRRYIRFLPVFGSIAFIMLYITATFYYPGGSQKDKNTPGFSWINNYWCNLLNEKAINGQANPAQPIAAVAMLFLCFSFLVFWIKLPEQLALNKLTSRTIQFSGALAMLSALLLFTTISHDLIINVSVCFGLIATTGTLIGLYRQNYSSLFWMGIINIVLIAVNNVLYYSSGWIHFLPLTQKITFALFIIWMCAIAIKTAKTPNRRKEGITIL